MTAFLRRFRPLLAYAALFSLFTNLLLLVPALYMLQVYDRVLTSRSNETLILLTVSAVIALAVMMLLDLLRTRLLAIGSLLLDKWLGPMVLQQLLSTTRNAGSPTDGHGLRDVEMLRAFLTGPAVLALFDAPWMVIFVLVIFLFHPVLGLIAAAGAIALLAVAVANERLMRQPLRDLQQHSRASGQFIELGLRNAEVINALGMAGTLTRRWEQRNDGVLELQRAVSRRSTFMTALSKFLRQFLQIAMLGAGAWLVVDQHVSGGVMIAATILLGRALAPVELLIAGWKGLIDARGAMQRLDSLLARQGRESVPVELPVPTGHLELERVVFMINGIEKPVIKGISFDLPAGEALGIIGPTASGKSTLARLIAGVWKPQGGTCAWTERISRTGRASAWGRTSATCPRTSSCSPAPIAENIARLGEVDSAAVVTAAQRAHAHDMILRLPKGYDTQVGRRRRRAGRRTAPAHRACARALRRPAADRARRAERQPRCRRRRGPARHLREVRQAAPR